MKQNTKEWIQYSSAIVLIISAIALAIISFILTLTVEGGVLAYVGEALGVSLAIYGVTSFFRNQYLEFQGKVQGRLDDMEKREKRFLEMYDRKEEEDGEQD